MYFMRSDTWKFHLRPVFSSEMFTSPSTFIVWRNFQPTNPNTSKWKMDAIIQKKKRCGCQMKGSVRRREDMDWGQMDLWSVSWWFVFEDTETEIPIGKSPNSRSETFAFCPQTTCLYFYVQANVLSVRYTMQDLHKCMFVGWDVHLLA